VKGWLTIALSMLAIALILAGVVYVHVSVWTECRESHSWLYCFRLVSR
jgi:hypothetical protein